MFDLRESHSASTSIANRSSKVISSTPGASSCSRYALAITDILIWCSLSIVDSLVICKALLGLEIVVIEAVAAQIRAVVGITDFTVL